LIDNFAETEESLLVISGMKGRINRAVWGPLNRTIITAGEDATIRIWDSEVKTPAHCSCEIVNTIHDTIMCCLLVLGT
jgi:WD40 repeat protein